MAAFKKSELREDWRIYQLLRFSPVSLFCNPQLLEEAISLLEGKEYIVHRFDCRNYKSYESIYNDILIRLGILQNDYVNIKTIQFWDLFTGLEVPDNSGLVVVFTNFEILQTTLPQCAEDVLEIFAGYHYKWLWFGLHFKVLMQTNDPLLEIKPFKTLSAHWNGKEHVIKNRLPQTES